MTSGIFSAILPHLTSAYERGLLVPFVGSGMSIGTCPSWQRMIERLEARAGIDDPAATVGIKAGQDVNAPEHLIRRANQAVRVLRHRGDGELPSTLRRVLGNAGSTPPEQITALAKRYWPLVLTTNYDDCYATAFAAAQTSVREELEVLGRSSADCHRILSSLTSPSGPLLWALQGYLDAPCRKKRGPLHPLADEVVVGHEEYSKVTHREAHFRRAFAEVYRQRSLMFVGSGLADPYLQGLFTEIQELHGSGTRRHYAFLKSDENVDARFMRARYNILIIPYGEHDELPAMLEQLDAACRERAMVNAMAYTIRGTENWKGAKDPEPDLVVERAKLPTRLTKSECAAVSVGGGGTAWYVSDMIKETFLEQPGIQRLIDGAKASNAGYGEPDRWYVRRYGDSPIFQVRARRVTKKDIQQSRAWGDRDIRVIREATRSLLNVVAETPFRTIRMQLLGAGGKRSFPSRVSLIQSIRAFGAWKRETGSDLRLVIHLVSPDVWLDITGGRINAADLASVDDIRFWVELIPSSGVPERRIFDLAGSSPLGYLLDLLAVPAAQWTAEVLPAPEVTASPFEMQPVLAATLDDLGVIPGSTLRLEQAT